MAEQGAWHGANTIPRYYLPWLTKVLDAGAVQHQNTLESHTHPNVLFNGESSFG